MDINMSMQGFNKDFELIRQALSSIELYQETYASTVKGSGGMLAAIAALRDTASARTENQELAALYNHVAEGLEAYLRIK
jgi:hypothetical protein